MLKDFPAMVADPLVSSEAFIKAIKGVSDPPVEGGLNKVELSLEALARSSLYVPAKAEVITEWAISKMFKEKMFQIESNSCLDERYWRLVFRALTTNSQGSIPKANYMWLNPLLLRYPLLPLMSTLMRHASSVSDNVFLECCAAVRAIAACSTIKPAFDSSLELLLETISAIAGSVRGDAENIWLEKPLAQSFTLLAIEHCRPTLLEGSNRKKALIALVNGPIVTWVAAQAQVQRLGSTDIDHCLSDMITSVLFSLESLRQHLSVWTMPDESQRSILEPLFSESADLYATLHVLPSFFRSLVNAIHKHRSTVFPSHVATSAERLPPKARAKKSSMAFLNACIKKIDKLPSQLLDTSWNCKSELLAVVEAETLIQSDDTDGHAGLAALTPKAVDALAQANPDSDTQRVGSLIRVLTSLIRLDHALVEPFFPDVFPVLARIPASPVSHEFLSAHLTYHIKTRTLWNVISLLCTTIASAPPLDVNFRRTFARSCVGDRSYASELGAAISQYLTQSQLAPTVGTIVSAARQSWTSFNELACVRSNVGQDPHAPKVKKRRISRDARARTTDSDAALQTIPAAARFSSLLSVASVVLSSVPAHTASPDVLSTIKGDMPTLREEVVLPAISAVLSSTEGIRINEPSQLVTAAALRLAYSLQGSTFWRFDSPVMGEMENIGRRADLLLRADDTLPELRVELVRTVLQHLSGDYSCPLLIPSPTFFDVLAGLLTSHLSEGSAEWGGSFSDFDHSANGQSAAILAIWELMLDRWLVIIDAYATPELLHIIVGTLIRFGTQADCCKSVTLSNVCHRALASAQFWEMPNIRPILLGSIEAKCQALGAVDIGSVLQASEDAALSDTSLEEAIRALHFVLHMPAEYLDKNRRALIARAAIICDVLLLKAGCSRIWDHILLRTLIFRVAQETGNVNVLTSNLGIVDFLSSSTAYNTDATGELSSDFDEITLKLLQLVHTSVSNAVVRGEYFLLDSLLDQYDDTQGNLGLKMRSGIRLLDSAATHADSTKLPTHTAHKFGKIFRMIHGSAVHALKKISFGDDKMISASVETLNIWESLLKVKAWLGIKDNSQTSFSMLYLLKPLTSQSASIRALHGFPEACLAVLRVIIQDSLFKADDTLEDVDTVLAAVVVVGQLLTTDGALARPDFSSESVTLLSIMAISAWRRLELIVARFSKALSLNEFSHALESMHGAVSAGSVKNERLFLVFLSSIFVRNSPDGSFKINQQYTSRCLHTIPRLGLVADSELANSGLRIILELVGDKSSSLRNADIASIYIILGQAVAGSTVHDSFTRHTMYETIVSILLALVRLRRDLVASSLSHFALVASRLCEILRTVRPELAARQRRSVTDTLPFWINPAQPLPLECAKALARLLTNLNTKTIVRTGPSARSDTSATQAQSLAQPFSKHAPYVITAYIRALINPLSVMTPRIRQELEPGLFALCDMMGEHGRDAIMTAMLDDSGKVMMRLLWTEYEKQRYAGRG